MTEVVPTLAPQGIRNTGNTCFLNAVLQALAACPTVLEYLNHSLQAHPDAEAPLADAVAACVASTAPQSTSSRRKSISPKQVLKAFREYIPADCLIDGEQNDSAEVLELLCSTLTSELAKHAATDVLQQAQQSWQILPSLQRMQGSGSHSDSLYPIQQADKPSSQLSTDTLENAQQQEDDAGATSDSWYPSVAETLCSIQSQLAEADAQRMPLQGNIVGDMSCLKCQHSFESQHTPFLLLPLALPTAQVTQKFGNGFKITRTAVAPRTAIQQCLQSFCGMELLQGVHCPRCTLQTALLTYSSAAEAASYPALAIQTAALATNTDMQSSASCSAKLHTHQASVANTADASSSSTDTDTSSSPSAQHTPTSAKSTAVSQGTLPASLDSRLCTCAETGSATGACAECLCRTAIHNGVNAQGLDHQQSEGLRQCNASYAQAGAAAIDKAEHRVISAGPHSSASVEASTAAQTATTCPGPLQRPLQPEQVQHRRIIEALLQSSQPWPAVDYEGLASKAGLAWRPVGSPCVKRISLGQPPKVLCLHLRRAFWTNQGTHVKLSGHVSFPLELDITPYGASSRGMMSSMAQQYEPSAMEASWMASTADQASQDCDKSQPHGIPAAAAAASAPTAAMTQALNDQEVKKQAATPSTDAAQQIMHSPNAAALGLAVLVRAGLQAKLNSSPSLRRDLPNEGDEPLKDDRSADLPEASDSSLQTAPEAMLAAGHTSPNCVAQPVNSFSDANAEGSDGPEKAMHSDASKSSLNASPFASYQLPFSPQAKPKQILASHALSFVASSVLDGCDDGTEVQAAQTRPMNGDEYTDSPQCDVPGAQDATSLLAQPLAATTHALSSGATPMRTDWYYLTAAVVHHGAGSGSGHYTVYRRVSDRSAGVLTSDTSGLSHWFSISDEHVKHVSVEEVVECEATLLLYAQR